MSMNQIIKISKENCPPCRTYGVIFDKMSKDFSELEFVSKKIEDDPGAMELLRQVNSASVPTTVIMKDNEVVAHKAGALQPSQLADFINAHI